MDVEKFIACIEDDAATMLDVIGTTPEDSAVPSCPGWDLRDLVVHTGAVHRHKTEAVRGAVRGEWVDGPPPWVADDDGYAEGIDDLGAWFADGVADMIHVFTTSDLTRPSWTWCPHEHSASWWVRRMAHETTIHRADAVLTAGGTPSVPTDLAIDGVDEIVVEMMVGAPPWSTMSRRAGAISLESGDRRWVLQRASFSGTSPNTGTVYNEEDTVADAPNATPDAVVRVDPSTMDLWLWGRAQLPEGAVSGDESLPAFVRSVAADATR